MPTVYNPKINYTWAAGAHSLKSGYEFQKIDTEVQDVNPLYAGRYLQQLVQPPGHGRGEQSLYNLADFMLGLRAIRPQQRAGGEPAPEHALRLRAGRLAVGSNLTLNLGVRYEFSTPYWEKDNVLSNFDPPRTR